MKQPVKPTLTHHFKTVLALSIIATSLTGCVVYPNRGYGYGPGYYGGPVIAPTVVLRGGWGWGGGWGGRGWR